MSRIVVATHNRKKQAELARILATELDGIEVASLDDFPACPEPAETEYTFAGNALLKARAGVEHTGCACIADDSGLQVDVLNKMPGVRSARWAGPQHDDEDNLSLLLAQIDDVPAADRTGRFCCTMALVLPDGTERVVEGVMEGTLLAERRGSNGFGYDPIFVPEGEHRTSAELSPEEKDAISHRGQALRKMVAELRSLAAEGRL